MAFSMRFSIAFLRRLGCGAIARGERVEVRREGDALPCQPPELGIVPAVSKMLGGASQIVSKIRVNCNGK